MVRWSLGCMQRLRACGRGRIESAAYSRPSPRIQRALRRRIAGRPTVPPSGTPPAPISSLPCGRTPLACPSAGAPPAQRVGLGAAGTAHVAGDEVVRVGFVVKKDQAAGPEGKALRPGPSWPKRGRAISRTRSRRARRWGRKGVRNGCRGHGATPRGKRSERCEGTAEQNAWKEKRNNRQERFLLDRNWHTGGIWSRSGGARLGRRGFPAGTAAGIIRGFGWSG